MKTQTPSFEIALSLFKLKLDLEESSKKQSDSIGAASIAVVVNNEWTKACSYQLHLARLCLTHGSRTSEHLELFIEKTLKLVNELFENPNDLKPLSEWSDSEKAFFFGLAVCEIANQTHRITIIEHINARFKDFDNFIRKNPGLFFSLFGSSVGILFLTNLIVIGCLDLPLTALAAFPAIALFGMVIIGLFIPPPETIHYDELVKEQEVTNLSQKYASEIGETINNLHVREHGRFKLPTVFFKSDMPRIPTEPSSNVVHLTP